MIDTYQALIRGYQKCQVADKSQETINTTLKPSQEQRSWQIVPSLQLQMLGEYRRQRVPLQSIRNGNEDISPIKLSYRFSGMKQVSTTRYETSGKNLMRSSLQLYEGL